VTTKANAKEVPAARFKAECIALLDEVAERGAVWVVTKRGRPVARVVPIERRRKKHRLEGTVKTIGDIVAPIGGDWDALSR
jgi:prevent-host-death family protein